MSYICCIWGTTGKWGDGVRTGEKREKWGQNGGKMGKNGVSRTHLLLLLQLLLLGLGELRDPHQPHGFALLIPQTLQVLNCREKTKKKINREKPLGKSGRSGNKIKSQLGKDLEGHPILPSLIPNLAVDDSRDGVLPFPGDLGNFRILGFIWRGLGITGGEAAPSLPALRIPKNLL